MNDIEIGDEITYTPTRRKYEDTVTGFVASIINGGDGVEVLAPLPGDEQRQIRLWLSNGTITKTGREAEWKFIPAPPSPTNVCAGERINLRPYKHPSDLASIYKSRGIDKHRAWDQFVIDTILQPTFRSESIDAKEFLNYYDLA